MKSRPDGQLLLSARHLAKDITLFLVRVNNINETVSFGT